MQFDSFSSFIHMGGYAFYVWLSFAVSFGVMAVLVFASYQQHKSHLKSVVLEQERQQRIKRAKQNAAVSASHDH